MMLSSIDDSSLWYKNNAEEVICKWKNTWVQAELLVIPPIFRLNNWRRQNIHLPKKDEVYIVDWNKQKQKYIWVRI